ncbi:MAG: NAD(P)H-binding protein [Deltaproteobacteria bacterium]|nr:NAD(P)H-binding protein [Deltaproteobacteria bacterium]
MDRAFVVGATGYTGREVVRVLCERGVSTIAHIRPDSPRLEEWREYFGKLGAPVNTASWEENAMTTALGRIQPTLIFNLVGTTKARMKQEKDASYEDVDYGLIAMLLRATRGAVLTPKLIHLSAAGVGPNSTHAYYQAKWKTEEEIRKSDLPYLVARPSFIIGADRDDSRSFELWGARLIDGAFLVASLVGARKLYNRYRSTTNTRLAQALVRLALDPNAINKVIESEELR